MQNKRLAGKNGGSERVKSLTNSINQRMGIKRVYAVLSMAKVTNEHTHTQTHTHSEDCDCSANTHTGRLRLLVACFALLAKYHKIYFDSQSKSQIPFVL